MIHGVVAMVALLAFSPAAWLLSRRLGRLPHQRLDTRVLESLAILCALCLLVFFVCLMPVFENRAPYALGFVERVLLALDVAWLVTAAVTMPRCAQLVDAPGGTWAKLSYNPPQLTARRMVTNATADDHRGHLDFAAGFVAGDRLQAPVGAQGFSVVMECGASSTPQVRTTLYFGLARPKGAVTELEWQVFLRDEVTARFPRG